MLIIFSKNMFCINNQHVNGFDWLHFFLSILELIERIIHKRWLCKQDKATWCAFIQGSIIEQRFSNRRGYTMFTYRELKYWWVWFSRGPEYPQKFRLIIIKIMHLGGRRVPLLLRPLILIRKLESEATNQFLKKYTFKTLLLIYFHRK